MTAHPPPGTPAEEVDVLVIGAGAAGSMAAVMAARSGANVLIVDKARFPRHKVCGCCLSSAAIALLRDAELGRQLDALGGVRIDRLDLRVPGAGAAARCEVALPQGLAISRAVLDQMLVDAAVQAGARFIDDCKATLGPMGAQYRHVQLRRDGTATTFRGRVVIGAEGLKGGSARTHTARDSRIGISALLTQVPQNWDDRGIIMACGAHIYAGLVRIDEGYLDLAAAVDPAWLRSVGGAHKACAAVLEACGVPVPGDLPGAGARFTGTPLLTCRPADVAEVRLLRVGDAAGYVEPFTGEGIAWALASGMVAGRLAGETLRRGDWHAGAEDQWRQQHRSLLASRQRRCRTIAKLLRRPHLVGAGTRLLHHLPGVAAPVIRRIHAPFTLDLHAQTI